MIVHLLQRLGLLAAGALLTASVVTALTNANNVPASSLSVPASVPITANTLKPAACASLTLNGVVAGATSNAGSTIPGSSSNDLLLGGPGSDTLGLANNGNGTDCCLGGDGTNTAAKNGGGFGSCASASGGVFVNP